MAFKSIINTSAFIYALSISFYANSMEGNFGCTTLPSYLIKEKPKKLIQRILKDTTTLYFELYKNPNSLHNLKKAIQKHAESNHFFSQITNIVDEFSLPYQFRAAELLNDIETAGYSDAESKIQHILEQIDTLDPDFCGLITKSIMLKTISSYLKTIHRDKKLRLKKFNYDEPSFLLLILCVFIALRSNVDEPTYSLQLILSLGIFFMTLYGIKVMYDDYSIKVTLKEMYSYKLLKQRIKSTLLSIKTDLLNLCEE